MRRFVEPMRKGMGMGSRHLDDVMKYTRNLALIAVAKNVISKLSTGGVTIAIHNQNDLLTELDCLEERTIIQLKKAKQEINNANH